MTTKQLRMALYGKASSREPVPAAKKKAVRERAKNTCQYPRCKRKDLQQGVRLVFHHKNQRNHNNRLSNLELLCPTHHAVRHAQKGLKKSRDILGGETKRLVKKKPKKKTVKKRVRRKTKKQFNPLDWL